MNQRILLINPLVITSNDATNVSLTNGSNIRSNSNQNAQGNAGEINITTGSLFLTDSSAITNSTFGQGDPSGIFITAQDTISLDNAAAIRNWIGEMPVGSSEGINITTDRLLLNNGAQITAPNNSQNPEVDGGDVNITAFSEVSFDGVNPLRPTAPSSIFTVVNTTETEGDGADIFLRTNGIGNAGDVTINANDVSLTDASTSIRSGVRPAGQGNGGDININATNVSLANGASLDASTFGQGNAGDININDAESVTVSGTEPFVFSPEGDFLSGGSSSSLFTSTEAGATGQGGVITITTSSLDILDGGVLSASSQSDSPGGNIVVNANTLEVGSGGQILSTAFSRGNAGDITLNVSDRISIAGSDPTFSDRSNQVEDIDPISPQSGIFANTQPDSTGEGGNISIGVFKSEGDNLVLNETSFTNEITLSEGGAISADSEGTGRAGQISISAKDLTLDNQGEIVAVTSFPPDDNTETPADNINITLRIDDRLTLDNNSLISAEALNNANGGNIDIDAKFIIAYPSSGNGNDIIASAGEGRGGNINIAASVFNLQEGEAVDGNGTNDIDASGGVDGEVNINTPNVDITQGLVEAPQNVVEPEQTTAQACQSDRLAGRTGGLIVKGKGGIPPEPIEPLDSDTISVDGQIAQPNLQTQHSDIKPIKTSIGEIFPARGIVKTEDGRVILTAYPTDNSSQRTPNIRANCTHS